jgi:hypothetical protein
MIVFMLHSIGLSWTPRRAAIETDAANDRTTTRTAPNFRHVAQGFPAGFGTIRQALSRLTSMVLFGQFFSLPDMQITDFAHVS